MILTRDGKEITAIYRQDGSEIEEVKDATGRIIYSASREITGTSPLFFTSRGKLLTDYRIYGETMQDGTPSPNMPVDVVGCGVRTEQLFEDKIIGCSIDAAGRIITNPDFNMYIAKVEQGVTYTASSPITGGFFTTKPVIGSVSYNGQRFAFEQPPITAPITGYMTFRVNSGSNEPMLNLGSTALPYEPYGYKLPVNTTNGTDTVTTPIYIGSEHLHRIGEYADYVDYSSGKIMRRIKKLVLTGGSADGNTNINAQGIIYITPLSTLKNANAAYCTRFKYVNQQQGSSMPSNSFTTSGGVGTSLWFKTDYTTVADFKSYLAAQYAAGTPVTVWYVLSEPIEEDPPVSFPELTTLSGTNTLTVDTTIKPSEIDLTGRIKTSGYGQLLDKNLTAINDSTGTPIFIRG